MARYNGSRDRGGAWRDLAWAAGGAAAVTLILVVGVGLIWLLGRTPSTVPVLEPEPIMTPTPRALSFAQRAATQEAPTKAPPPPTEPPPPTATAPAATETADDEPAAAEVPATPELLAMPTGEDAVDAQDDAPFAAPAEVSFASLATGSWTASTDTLVNPGSSAVAEPWLTLTAAPAATFAVEAEIRITGLLDSVCDQSFGLVGGSPSGQTVYGGGLLFPCDGSSPRARITDVAVWQDGFNADPVVAEEPFDPGDDWHTYRFEVRGDRLRLIVDGERLVGGEPPVQVDPSLPEIEAGLWSQGTGVEVRRVEVLPLPAE
jgi:hypothetical protein